MERNAANRDVGTGPTGTHCKVQASLFSLLSYCVKRFQERRFFSRSIRKKGAGESSDLGNHSPLGRRQRLPSRGIETDGCCITPPFPECFSLAQFLA